MLVAKDPASPTSVPGMPFVRHRRVGNVVRLSWNQSDSGNSMINNYQILRGIAPGAENPVPIATVAGTQIGGSYTDTTATDPTKTYYYKVVATNSMGASCPSIEVAAPYQGDTCTGLILHRNDPTHPESTGGGSAGQPPVPQLLIDYIALGEPPATNNLMFKMKVGDLSTIPPNSRWRIAWDWYHPNGDPANPDQLYYVGMNSDNTGVVTFEYGTLADAGVPAVLVLQETKLGDATGSSFSPDGTITMIVPKSGVGNPQTGDLLGAVGGKTITGDTPGTKQLERSTTFVDHTFVKGNTDNAFPAVTYTLAGNPACSSGTLVPVGAVSRKTHGTAGTYDIDLPLLGGPGVECRAGGPTGGNHKMVITFAAPVTVGGSTTPPPSAATVTGTGTVSNITVNGSVVTVDLTGVANAQIVTVTLNNVSDGTNTGNVAVPMGVLFGDVNGVSGVSGSDVNVCKSQVGLDVGFSNFREDVNINGSISGSDVNLVKAQVGTTLP